MVAPSFPLDANTVRDYMAVSVGTTNQYTDTTIGSNMRVALAMIERKTHRYFGGRTGITLKFTTQGKPYVGIPGLRMGGTPTLTLVGSSLTVDETYHLIPDVQQTGVAVGIQLRGFDQRSGGPWWLSSSEWFDRNLDSPYHPGNRGWGGTTIPNDLVIVGDWGYANADMPDDAIMAVKIMTAHLTTLAAANSQGILTTGDGNVFDLSTFPSFVQSFVRDWGVSPGVGAGS